MDYITEPQYKVVMERPEPTFYAKIPKMAMLDLNPYELALYVNYKQTASESGSAWKSNKTLSKETSMSVRMVQDCRKELEKKGYIRCEYKKDENGVVSTTVIVTIVDIWQENHERYASKPMHSVHTPMQDTHTPHAPHAPKEESVKKNQEEDILLQSMIAAVKKELKQSNKTQYTAIAKALLGYFTGKDIEKNIVGAPYTPERLLAFCLWWDNCHKDKAGKSLTRPKNQGTVKTWIEAWQEEIKPLVVMETNHPNSSNGKLTPQQAMALEIRMLQDGK